MCGIAGIVSLDGRSISPADLQSMADVQSHRGPDGEGYMLASIDSGCVDHAFARSLEGRLGRVEAHVGLAHRRLAILDLSDRGLQPMATPDGRAWIVFNGEIYNYRSLRDELASRGHEFRTGTDTEILLAAYTEWGVDCLPRLEGMFAFAIWDSRHFRLFCARDRLGIKPFYYSRSRHQFSFASEMKALLVDPVLDRSLDDTAVLAFLAHGNCDYGDRTLIHGIRALPGGHALTLDLATSVVKVFPYWSLQPQQLSHAADAERIAELKDLLFDAMRKHLQSDVQAGSCLSGGLDSSAVVGVAGKIWRESPDDASSIGSRFFTFTSCYDDKAIDEREFAQAVADKVGATSNLVYPSAHNFWSVFEKMAWHQDMPFSGLSFYAQWRVMRAAREAGVKVLLDGQGGDEVFGGYAKFRYAYLAALLRGGKIPGFCREAFATLKQGDRYVLNIRNGHRYLPPAIRRLLAVDSLMSSVVRTDWERVVTDESTPATRWWRNASSGATRSEALTAMQRIQIDDLITDTLPTLLRMEDRSSMAFSLEARVPLLDHRLVEMGVSLPDNLKVRNGWSKYAIRQTMCGILPEPVRLRTSKLGFAAPDRRWLVSDLKPQVSELIQNGLRCNSYIDTAALERWYSSPESLKANTESYLGLFRILSLEMWMRAFEGARPASSQRIPAASSLVA